MNFADALKEQILQRKETRRGKKLLDLINSPPSKRRTRILGRLEAHASTAVQHELGVQGIIDWSKVDWSKVFNIVLKLLIAILPLLMAL